MKERDQARKMAASATGNEKIVLFEKYKALRNATNRLIRRDTKESSAKKITESNDPAMVWKQVSDVINPRSSEPMKIIIDDQEIEDEEKIANAFNEFFVNKVQKLSDNIDPTLKDNPTHELEAKMQGKRNYFQLKPIGADDVNKAIQRLKPKKARVLME